MSLSTTSSERGQFLVRAVLHSLGGGALGILFHVLYHLVGHVLADKDRKVSTIKALFTALDSNIEPLTIIALLGVLFGLFRFIWTIAPGNRLGLKLNRADLIYFCEALYEPNLKSRGPVQMTEGVPLPGQLETVGEFLQIMGVVERVGGNARPVSGLADAFLCSLSANLREARPNFMAEWDAKPNTTEWQRTRKLLQEIEEHRIAGRPIIEVLPARKIRSGLAMIRADSSNGPVFLMINSTQWGSPGWWFLGGTEEPKDQADLAKTVRREVKEEIGASDGDDVVLDVHPLIGQCNDKRISGRYGVLTEYYYQLFSVRLRPEHSKIAPLLATDRPVVTIPYVPAMREHQLRWMTFDDVLNEPHLITHTPGIIAEMKRSLMPNMIVSSGNRT